MVDELRDCSADLLLQLCSKFSNTVNKLSELHVVHVDSLFLVMIGAEGESAQTYIDYLSVKNTEESSTGPNRHMVLFDVFQPLRNISSICSLPPKKSATENSCSCSQMICSTSFISASMVPGRLWGFSQEF